MSFALAAQVVARGNDRAVAKRVRSFLETNQAAFFEASRDWLAGEDIARALGLAGRRDDTVVRRIRKRRLLRTRDVCSYCDADLPKEAVECPKCGGRIEGAASSEPDVDVDGILNQLKKE